MYISYFYFMGINGPSEDYAPKQETPETSKAEELKQLNETLQSYLEQATEEMRNNPQLQEAIHGDFENMLQSSLEKNPTAFLEKIDADMHTKIESAFDQLQKWEIYLEDAKNEAKNAVKKATTLKLLVEQKIFENQK